MTTPIASLSLDLDNKWSYLKTHGDRGWESFPSYLGRVVPRFLDVLGELQLRITVFVVGQDAALARNRESLAKITAAEHEIGNHSFHHEPWLHRYSAPQIADELQTAEDAIETATGARATGFRGPGYSLTPTVIAALAARGYRYDASTLPTFLGPLARTVYFLSSRLSSRQREERKRLFGTWREGLRPNWPYWWQVGPRRLLEIPVTTLPMTRTPIHFSYLLYLRQFSLTAAWTYWRLALRACATARVEPSLLLHPLDFLGGDDEPDLGFFPAMRMRGAEKVAFVRALLVDLAARFRVLPLGEYAAEVASRENLRSYPVEQPAAAAAMIEEVASP